MWGYNNEAEHSVTAIVSALVQISFSAKYRLCATDEYN
jgi:hypothetical protein